MVSKNDFFHGVLAYAEADIRIDKAWNRAHEILLEIFSSQKYICLNFDTFAVGMKWKPGKKFKQKYAKRKPPRVAVESAETVYRREMPNLWWAFPYKPTGQVFTQYCSCGMIFRGENGDEVANVWRLHVANEHTTLINFLDCI